MVEMTAFKEIMFVAYSQRIMMMMMMTVLCCFSPVGSVRCGCCYPHFEDNGVEAQRG